MNQILEQLGTYGIVPVVVLQDAAKAEPLAEALCKGGLACAEVTFRTDAAEESIRIMSEKFPEMLVGAGTVLTIEQADRAVKAGAKFIVSPGLNPEVVKWCQAHEVPVIPGIVTPTEMAQAIGLGLTMVKFFPAEPAGLVEPGEEFHEAAVREMHEETGLTFHPLKVDPCYEKPFFTTIGLTDEACSAVYGWCEGEISRKYLEESEVIEVVLADREEAKRILKEENVAIMCSYHLMHFIHDEEPFAFLK